MHEALNGLFKKLSLLYLLFSALCGVDFCVRTVGYCSLDEHQGVGWAQLCAPALIICWHGYLLSIWQLDVLVVPGLCGVASSLGRVCLNATSGARLLNRRNIIASLFFVNKPKIHSSFQCILVDSGPVYAEPFSYHGARGHQRVLGKEPRCKQVSNLCLSKRSSCNQIQVICYWLNWYVW